MHQSVTSDEGSTASLMRRRSLAEGFRLASAASNDCLWQWDLATDEIHRSRAMATRFGYSSEEISPSSTWWRDRIHADDRASASRSIEVAIEDPNASGWSCEYRFLRSNGTYAQVCDRAYILRNDNGKATRLVGAVMDLSEITEAHRALRRSEERYRFVVELTGQIAWTADAEGSEFEFDERWASYTGMNNLVTSEERATAAHPDDLAEATRRWEHSLKTGEPFDLKHRLRSAAGEFRWFRTRAAAHLDSSGRVERWYGTIEDIHERISSRNAFNRLENFDELTGLANRRMFFADLESRFGQARDSGTTLALIILDLDDFKSVNDLFGHDTGDMLLTVFAERMINAGVVLYRIGGDEFAAILELGAGRDEASAFSERVHAAIRDPVPAADTILECRASIGCALFPAHGNSPSELLKSADIALYAAKAAGSSHTRIFANSMRNELQRRSSMLNIAREFLSRDRVTAYFQPKVSLRTGQIVGFEALMRLRDGRFGAQPPGVIDAAFQHPELAGELADRVLAKVASVVRDWRQQSLTFGRIAINASPLEFRGGSYAERFLSKLRENGVSPEDIEVEVTETVLLNRSEDAILDSLRALKDAGVTVALDDFGTGYASLSHLRQYPVDVLKIDRSFIQGIVDDERQRLITKGVIHLSRTIGIQTVAEGIETTEQADLLESFGCEIGQGYLFGQALCENDAAAMLSRASSELRVNIEGALQRSTALRSSSNP